MVRAQSSDNLKIWACTSDGVRKSGDATNDNTAAITLFYECKNVSVQRCKGSNSEHLARDKRPNDGTAPSLSMRFCTNGLNQRKLFSMNTGGGGTSYKWSICQNNVVAGVANNPTPNSTDNSIGIFTGNSATTNDLHHWSNNTFYYSGSGELGAIDTYFDNVIAYNNLYYDARIAIHDRVNGSGNFLYLDYEQSFRPSWAEIYWEGSSSTWAAVATATTFADNISTADPNFADTTDFVPQNSDALTGGVGGTERGYRLTGVEMIGPVGLQVEGSVVSSANIDASGNTLTIELSEVLTVAGGGLNDVDFSITGGGTLSSVTLDASGNTITATISPVVEAIDGNLTVTYTQPGSGLQASAVDIDSFEVVAVNGSTMDTTAPVLSSPIGTPTGTTTATGTVTTDEGNGTLYWEVTASATPPASGPVATITSKQDLPSEYGETTDPLGVSFSTTTDGSGSGATLTCTARTFDAGMQLYRVDQFTLNAGGTGYQVGDSLVMQLNFPPFGDYPSCTVATTSSNATFISDATSAGDTQTVSATGSQIVSVTGLSAATSYYIHFLHVDAASNESNVSTSAQFTTQAVSVPSGGTGEQSIISHNIIKH